MTEALAQLIARGRHLREALMRGDTSAPVRAWQTDCAAVVSELSGGVKAHWLSRAFSDSLLVRGAAGIDAPVIEIVERIVGVLEQARDAIAQAGGLVSIPEGSAPVPRRFEFVHDTALRPVLEQAFDASRDALDGGRFEDALRTACGILEAIITDALTVRANADPAAIANWSFDDRIAAAEQAGLIRGGCARLTGVARHYRDGTDLVVTERDARVAGQVLRVVMRDLDPGR